MAKRSTDTSDTDNEQGISAAEAAELRRELAAANAEKAAALSTVATERTARRKAEFAGMTHAEQAIVSQQEACETEISGLEDKANALEAQMAALADEPGHGAEIAKINREIARAEANILAAQGRKEWLAQQREQVTTRNKGAREAAERDDTGAGVDILANGSKLADYGPATQRWLRDHPQAFSDQRYLNRAIRYAQEATEDKGIKDQSPEYFAFIEERLGDTPGTRRAAASDEEGDDVLNSDEEDDADDQGGQQERYVPEKPQHRAAGPGSMAAAPTRRTPTGGGDNNGRRVVAKLSAQEREVADGLYASMKPAERYQRYAENKGIMGNLESSHFNNTRAN